MQKNVSRNPIHIYSISYLSIHIWHEYSKLSDIYRYYISVTEHHLLNRPEQPCEEKEDYDFLECVKTSQARMVGCRPPWDIWSPLEH